MRSCHVVPFLLFVLLSFVANAAEPAVAGEAQVIQLEKGKWDPPSLGDSSAFMALFADDFVSVEYGTDVGGGVTRKTRAEVFSGAPLPPAKFELSAWQVMRPSADVLILSYRVNALSFPWRAYATSIWARRNNKWQTVFYQASTAK